MSSSSNAQENTRGREIAHIFRRRDRDGPALRRTRHFQAQKPSPGWEAPATEPWLLSALHAASERHFGKPAMFRCAGSHHGARRG